jgi:hypothetical protein
MLAVGFGIGSTPLPCANSRRTVKGILNSTRLVDSSDVYRSIPLNSAICRSGRPLP